MELVYLYHSGFALLGEAFTIIFDYYEDSKTAVSGVLHDELLQRPGKFYVLASHSHYDHFNQDILTWRERRKDIIYLFSKDICQQGLATLMDAVYLEKGGLYRDELLAIRAFGSTDEGVSFLVEIGGYKIFHAGDLNNWHWMEESDEAEWRGYENHFLCELDDIYRYAPVIDLVMFPVDPRLGREYMRGPRQFVEKIKTAIFVPMHFDEAYAQAEAFLPVAESLGMRMVVLAKRGQREYI